MSHLLDGVLHLPPLLALALVLLLPALEASVFVGVVVPGEIGVILGGSSRTRASSRSGRSLPQGSPVP